MTEKTTGTEAQETTETTEQVESQETEAGQETAAPSIGERIKALFPGREVRSAQLTREDAATAEAAKATRLEEAAAAKDGESEEEDDEGEEEAGGAQPNKRKRGKRRGEQIRGLRGEISERDLRIANLEGQIAAQKPATKGDETATETGQKGDGDAEPQEEDFDTMAEYYKAMGRYGARQEMKERDLADEVEDQRLTETERKDKTISNWNDQIGKGRERWEDFESVALSTEIPYSGAMIDRVAQSELGAELAYHLGRNPSEATRIAHLEPPDAVAALAVIEADIHSGRIAFPTETQDDASTGETQTGESADATGEQPTGEADAGVKGGVEETTKPAPSRTRAADPLKPVKGGEKPVADMPGLAKSNPTEYMRLSEERHKAYLQNKQ